MTSFLAFILECAATAVFAGAGASLLALSLFFVSRPLARKWAPARQADLTFLLGTAPAAVCISVVLAAAAPSVGSALGLVADHCSSHRHHVHLCIIHSAGLRPLLATVGALASAIFIFRATVLLRRVMETNKRLRVLERLGEQREGLFPVIAVPGAPALCHAVGIFRRRVVVSADLLKGLSPDEARAALAHEEAHLRRGDPAALLALSICSLFMLPMAARFLISQFHTAAEEACDTEAACAVADAPLVAAALVKVASLTRSAPVPAPVLSAFGEGILERRVRLLLEDHALSPTPARSLWLGGSFGMLGLMLVLLSASQVHHAVETALHHFF